MTMVDHTKAKLRHPVKISIRLLAKLKKTAHGFIKFLFSQKCCGSIF
jgi:hypothetical protein